MSIKYADKMFKKLTTQQLLSINTNCLTLLIQIEWRYNASLTEENRVYSL